MRPTVETRKTIKQMTKEQLYDILNMYGSGVPVSTIATDLNISKVHLKKWISRKVGQLVSMQETKALTKSPVYSMVNATKNPKYINKTFTDKLSNPHGPLTDEEQMYCYLYVESGGDNEYALKGSELDEGLPQDPSKMVFDLRGQYLRNKMNVSKEIREHRLEFIKQFGVSKEDNQGRLVDLIVQLKNKGNAPSQLLKTIELLMKSEDQLTTNIKVTEVSPEDEMKKLFDLIKDDDETYVSTDTQATESLPEESD